MSRSPLNRLRRGRPAKPDERQPRQLRVNPVACQAHGICIELLPERITADPWGYPIVAPGLVPDELLPLAQRAVNSCPTLALLLVAPEQPAREQPAPEQPAPEQPAPEQPGRG